MFPPRVMLFLMTLHILARGLLPFELSASGFPQVVWSGKPVKGGWLSVKPGLANQG